MMLSEQKVPEAKSLETKGLKTKFPVPEELPIPSVIRQNMDMEPYVIQGAAGRSVFFHDPYVPLQFLHFSDIHGVPELWERITEYLNYYSDFIQFGLHTGDFCGNSHEQYVDFYHQCTPCVRPILNCVGNHDTYQKNPREKEPLPKAGKEKVYDLLFTKTGDWRVTFMEGAHSMTYFRDFPKSGIRLMVLDFYYDLEEQCRWLRELLNDAKEKGLSVITAGHEPLAPIGQQPEVTFRTIENFEQIESEWPTFPFDEILADFKGRGGNHVCHLAGHMHYDVFGYTDRGILNIAVPCASDWDLLCDGKRIRGTRTYDCFQVVAVDPVLHQIKLIRIGNQVDHYLRSKRILCFDYQEKRVIFNA